MHLWAFWAVSVWLLLCYCKWLRLLSLWLQFRWQDIIAPYTHCSWKKWYPASTVEYYCVVVQVLQASVVLFVSDMIEDKHNSHSFCLLFCDFSIGLSLKMFLIYGVVIVLCYAHNISNRFFFQISAPSVSMGRSWATSVPPCTDLVNLICQGFCVRKGKSWNQKPQFCQWNKRTNILFDYMYTIGVKFDTFV